MSTIRIPLSVALFPVTLPVFLCRSVLGLITTILVGPITLISAIQQRSFKNSFGWKSSVKFLSAKLAKENIDLTDRPVEEPFYCYGDKNRPASKLLLYRYKTVPGWLPRLASWRRTKEGTFYRWQYGESSHWTSFTFVDGSSVPTSISYPVQDQESAQKSAQLCAASNQRTAKFISQLVTS